MRGLLTELLRLFFWFMLAGGVLIGFQLFIPALVSLVGLIIIRRADLKEVKAKQDQED